MGNNKDELEEKNEEIETYIGIEASPSDDSCPSICVEFNISLKVFAIAYALSIIEKKSNCSEKDETKKDCNI